MILLTVFCFFICSAAACVPKITPFTFTFNTRSISCSSSAKNVPTDSTPALFTQTSKRPNALTASSARRNWSARLATLPCTAMFCQPFWSNSALTLARLSALMSCNTTAKPSCAKRVAMALPKPAAEPVTTATFLSDMTDLSFGSLKMAARLVEKVNHCFY